MKKEWEEGAGVSFPSAVPGEDHDEAAVPTLEQERLLRRKQLQKKHVVN